MSVREQLTDLAARRILVLDGAMGTMIQGYGLGETDYRGQAFADHPSDLKGNNDLLSLTRPAVVREIHGAFLDAGADILSTNTFNANRFSQADYGLEDQVTELNLAAAAIARAAADAASTPEKPRFVAGALGPMNKTLSVSPDVNRPGHRDVTFDQVREAYAEQTYALMDGGVDILLIETIFDTLNAKAALVAISQVCEVRGVDCPIILSGTITDLSGRNLSGQTVEAFWHSVRHAKPLAVGLNCSFGAAELRPYVASLSAEADTLISAYPNAGLPNEMGGYDEQPDTTAGHIGQWARDGLVNIVGGCCGTTPGHIRAIARAVDGVAPRAVPVAPTGLKLSGMEAVTL